jgi:murein DD-endopeptidase MepM/ murein hydrolase activator NlpD
MRRLLVVLAAGALALPAGSGAAPTAAAAGGYLLPVPAGISAVVTVGRGGYHQGYEYNAFDFALGGDPEFAVAAARGGTVKSARRDSSAHCSDLSCWAEANYVLVDHGDGTQALYLHLAQGKVAVKAGDRVRRGDVIATAGNTGFSTENHLHFQVEDAADCTAAVPWWCRSLPVSFDDPDVLSKTAGSGVPVPDIAYTSANASAAATLPPAPTPEPTRPPVLGGAWASPADGATLKSSVVTLSATPTAALTSVHVTKVTFYATWVSKAPKAACTATKADAKGVWSCKADLWKVGAPLGALTLSFDVFDDAGDLGRSPAGVRSVTFAAPPPAPTHVAFKNLTGDTWAIPCSAAVGEKGNCGKFRVTWKWGGQARGASLVVYYADAGNWDCASSDCTPLHEQCLDPNVSPPVKVASVDAATGRWEGLTPPPYGTTCFWLLAKNAFGSSPKVLSP